MPTLAGVERTRLHQEFGIRASEEVGELAVDDDVVDALVGGEEFDGGVLNLFWSNRTRSAAMPGLMLPQSRSFSRSGSGRSFRGPLQAIKAHHTAPFISELKLRPLERLRALDKTGRAAPMPEKSRAAMQRLRTMRRADRMPAQPQNRLGSGTGDVSLFPEGERERSLQFVSSRARNDFIWKEKSTFRQLGRERFLSVVFL
jgi:hypothetical protein